MPYKKKFLLLVSIAAVLALIYTLTLVFDPVRINARNERFTWLPADLRDQADRIEITHGTEKLELVFRNGTWFVQRGLMEVPARQGRIDDLFRLLSTRGAFPRRGGSSERHAELGLDGGSRLVIRGGAGLPLLDLLVGNTDSAGKAVFLRKNGENEFRSGDRQIGNYVNGDINSWLNLRLFDEKSTVQVQRILVSFYDYYGMGEEISPVPYNDYTITRSGENWMMGNDTLDRDRTENWINAILQAQGETILFQNEYGAFSRSAMIRVELGDGSVLELEIGKEMPDGKCPVLVSGKSYQFILSQWLAMRMLRNSDYFTAD